MKAKAKRALKHLEKIKVAKWAVEALKDYFNLCEQQVVEVEMSSLAIYIQNSSNKKILQMLGFDRDDIDDKIVDFLYSNIDDIREKNKDKTLRDALLGLQVLFDDLEFYGKMFDCEVPFYSISDVRKQEDELNKRYKEWKKGLSKENKKKLNEKYRGHKVGNYGVDDYRVPEV